MTLDFYMQRVDFSDSSTILPTLEKNVTQTFDRDIVKGQVALHSWRLLYDKKGERHYHDSGVEIKDVQIQGREISCTVSVTLTGPKGTAPLTSSEVSVLFIVDIEWYTVACWLN